MVACGVDASGISHRQDDSIRANVYDAQHMACAPPDMLIGTLLDERYRVVQHIATGGVGHLYVVEDERVRGRKKPCFAAKVLRFEHVGNDVLQARFVREIEATTKVRHPHVLALHHHGRIAPKWLAPSAHDVPYFVTDLLTGMDVADTLELQKWFAPTHAVHIAMQMAEGLAAAHSVGVVHRDVKPENVFLALGPDARTFVTLLDFGLAWIDTDQAGAFSSRLTVLQAGVGTPEYMPAEQAFGDIGRPSADIYALGIVLYEMLSGRLPFTGSPEVLAGKHAREEPPPLDRGSRALQQVVQRALLKDPSSRYESALVMREALGKTPEGQGVLTAIS